MPGHKLSKRQRRQGQPWTTGELKRLGKTPDSVLAQRRQRTITEIVAEREARGIARFG